VKLDIIENSGPDNLRDTLKTQLHRMSEVSIAVAFVTQSGLDDLAQRLQQIAINGSVRLLTGLYQKVTEPDAMRSLLRIQKETRGRFAVRPSKEPRFHRKFYLLRTRGHAVVILGSSNLTRDGMRSGGELNLIAHLPRGSPVVKKITRMWSLLDKQTSEKLLKGNYERIFDEARRRVRAREKRSPKAAAD
jgi:HKD family nuclease